MGCALPHSLGLDRQLNQPFNSQKRPLFVARTRGHRHETPPYVTTCLFPLPARRLVFWFFSSSACRRTIFSICSGSILCCLLESAMRHVPGFDQGWRGYDDKKQRRGNDPGSSINNVEDDSRKKGKKAKTLDPRSEPVLDVCNRGSGMTDKRQRKNTAP